MTSVQVGINAQSNGYRSDGLRAWKGWNVVLPQGENDAVAPGTYFYYDGGFPALETNSSGTVTAINVFAPDGLVARKVSGAWRHYQFDAQGSVMHRLRDDETVINHSKYDAYGMHVSVPFPVADAFGYNGRWGYYSDDETGLILCMHRYYDAASGRWLTRDPIGYEGGVNLYGYCGGNPIGPTDRTGLVPPGMVIVAAEQLAYFPKRGLPTQHGLPVPDSEWPHTQLGIRKGRGGYEYPQSRTWSLDGTITEIDWTDHGRPSEHPMPHAHDRPFPGGPRGAGRAVPGVSPTPKMIPRFPGSVPRLGIDPLTIFGLYNDLKKLLLGKPLVEVVECPV